MPAKSPIKWRKQDNALLAQTVANFNKKLDYHLKKTPESALWMPKRMYVSELKQEIATRADFNRVINMLKRFGKKGAEKAVKSPGGIITTAWERRETGYQQGQVNRAKRRRKMELEPSTYKGTMGAVEELDLKPRKFNWKKGKQADWEKFKQSVFKQAFDKYQQKKAEHYYNNYKTAVNNKLGLYGDAVLKAAAKAGGLWLFDAYSLDQRLQIDYPYTENDAAVKTASIMDAFAEQGFLLSDIEIGENPLTDNWREYSDYYNKGTKKQKPLPSGMDDIQGDLDEWE